MKTSVVVFPLITISCRLEKVSLSFNGGKDCTVLLHLFAAALSRYLRVGSPTQPTMPKPIFTIYVTHPNSFSEVDEFVNDTIQRYNLDLVRIESPIKQALLKYKELHPNIEAILVGTRRNDPHGGIGICTANLLYFQQVN
jgi:FAD synthetase